MRLSIFVLLFLGFSAVCSAATIIVGSSGSDFREIQPAIDSAKDGDIVLVKIGTHGSVQPITFRGKAITVKSQSGAALTSIEFRGPSSDSSSAVIFESGETTRSVLQGFTVKGGKGSADRSDGALILGGGILCRNGSSPTIQDCRISGNSGGIEGGGVACDDSSPIILNCTIDGNSAMFGAGISFTRSSAQLIRCTIQGNAFNDSGGGGGVYCFDSSPTFQDCTIARNAAKEGGGMYCLDSAPAIEGCRIELNVCWNGSGGGCFSKNSSPLFTESRIERNLANIDGGGLYFEGEAALSFIGLTACKVSGNAAERNGGGIFSTNSSPLLTNCAIAGNLASGYGGAYSSTMSSGPFLTNCTISWNEAIAGNGGISCADIGVKFPTVRNSIVWGNLTNSVCGTTSHNLTAEDPRFRANGSFDTSKFQKFTIRGTDYFLPDFTIAEPDFRLRLGSPAIDQGDPAIAPPDDFLGTPRPCGNGFDIGAYENCEGARFRRGDPNADGKTDISDPISILGFLFLGEPARLSCRKSADADDSGILDISDGVSLLNHLFLGAPPPREPLEACGFDPTEDDLPCESFPPCI